MLAYLRATTGSLTGTTFLLGARILLGRAGDADIQLTESAVSRRHALILRLDDGRFWIGDLSSTNGTFLHDRRIESHCLEHGDVVHLGMTSLVFEDLAGTGVETVGVEGPPLRLLSGPVEKQTHGVSLQRLRQKWYHRGDPAGAQALDTLPIGLPPAVGLGFGPRRSRRPAPYRSADSFGELGGRI